MYATYKISEMRNLFLLLVFSFCFTAQAQLEFTAATAKKTVETFFEGFHKGDTLLMRSVMHPDMQLNTTFKSKSQGYILDDGAVDGLLKAISDRPKEQVWKEELLDYKIEVDHTLANVWTPYSFSVNGKFSHCGANNFTLVATNEGWKIRYLIDSRKREGCE